MLVGWDLIGCDTKLQVSKLSTVTDDFNICILFVIEISLKIFFRTQQFFIIF